MVVFTITALLSSIGIAEPDVTLTDYGLTIETALFAYLLARATGPRPTLRNWFIVFFASIGAASLLGGTVHGLALEAGTTSHNVLWSATLFSIGVTALSAWVIGSKLLFAPRTARWISIGAAAGFVAYCVVVLFVTQEFRVAILDYLPAAVFLLAVFGILYARSRERKMLLGVGGLVLTFVAAGVQQARVAIDPRYFDHNALYHLLQAVALLMLFGAARWLVGRGAVGKASPGRYESAQSLPKAERLHH